MEECWKDLKSFEGLYKISNYGKILNLRTNSLMKLILNKGYLECGLSKDGKRKNYLVHRLVALNFVENLYNKPQVNHIDEDKTNNKSNNLSWVTAKENSNHGSRNERIKSNHRKSWDGVYILKKDGWLTKIRSICKETKTITEFSNLKEAGIKTGIHQSNISNCLNGKRNSAGGFFWEKVMQ